MNELKEHILIAAFLYNVIDSLKYFELSKTQDTDPSPVDHANLID